MAKDSFVFRCDIIDRLSCYNDEDFRLIINSIASYVRYGEVPNLPQHLMYAFNFIKIDIDSDAKKYEETCEKNREKAFKRWEKEKKKELC